jgi:hypothetical protein
MFFDELNFLIKKALDLINRVGLKNNIPNFLNVEKYFFPVFLKCIDCVTYSYEH